jgi:hypothetical protein
LYRVARARQIPRIRRDSWVETESHYYCNLQHPKLSRDHPYKVKLTVFNSSSIASGSLADILKTVWSSPDFRESLKNKKSSVEMDRARLMNSQGLGFYRPVVDAELRKKRDRLISRISEY